MKKLRYVMAYFFLFSVLWLYADTVSHYHTVKKGETLSSISRKYNVPVSRIKNLNNMKSSVIQPRQKLVIRKASKSSTASKKKSRESVNEESTVSGQTSTVYHKVRKGDNLTKISRKYNVPVARIKKLNKMKSDRLAVGKNLKIAVARKEAPKQLPAVRNPEPIISVSEKTYYTVKKGETLKDIADRFGLSIESIKKNNLLDDRDLKEGQVLVIQNEMPEDGDEFSMSEPVKELTLREKIVRDAYDFIGTPYRLGGNGKNGIDCSSLTRVVYYNAGLKIPGTSNLQYKKGVPVSVDDAEAGDLVFFRRGGYIYHVGIYIGDNLFIHASTSQRKVAIASLENTYFKRHFADIRRFIATDWDTLAKGNEYAVEK